MKTQLEFNIDNFVGPMDLLLHLIKETKMDIYEVNITNIIDQFLSYIDSIQVSNIEVSSEFLVMASELLHLKSKKLIGKLETVDDGDEFSIISEEDLIKKLIEYEQYKNIIKELKVLEEKRAEIHTKVPENLSQFEVNELENIDEVTADILMQAFIKLQERLHFNEPVNTKITQKELSVTEKIKNIRKVLKEKKVVEFTELFETATKEYVVVTFLAILQMSKNAEIDVKQENNFDHIWIEEVNHE